MNNQLPILIIGAGPTGLMMACELARFGIPFRLFDKSPGTVKNFQPVWLQPSCLEIFNHIGIVDQFLAVGKRCDAVNLHVNGKSRSYLPLSNIDSVYPYILLMPPQSIETILTKHLESQRGRIERTKELIDLKTKSKLLEASVCDSRGRVERTLCQWLIACDGSNSVVREKCHLYFSNDDSTKMVKTMREGQIFLAGEAAYTHSLGFGQGVNAGIQDAYNLAWKLALVCKQKAKITLLDSYNKERQPAIKTIIHQSQKFSHLQLADKSQLQDAYFEDDSKKILNELTQVNLQYRYSSIIDYSVKLNIKAPRQGARMPNVLMTNQRNLYDYLRNNHHNIFIFLSKTSTQNLTKIFELQMWANTEFANLVRVHVVSREKIADVDNLIHDPHGLIQARLNIDGTAIYLIRPDTYIAYASHNLAANPLKKLFNKFTYNPSAK